jgi:ATP-dependent helicase/nuclease subunit A
MTSILAEFDFTEDQQRAAVGRNPAITVTAGAGSGKTRTLVGRYLHLLEEGYPLRSLVAVTFTDKAAREMRTRIRLEIENWLDTHAAQASSDQRQLWENAFAGLEAVRIGTLHSLCAEILRMHPAEAGIDPNFSVLEEGLAAALQAQALNLALAWAAGDPQAATLFGFFSEGQLRRILANLLNHRLDLGASLRHPAPLMAWSQALEVWLQARWRTPAWSESLAVLADLHAADPGDLLEIDRQDVLASWEAVRQAEAGQDWDELFTGLLRVRQAISTKGRKENWDPADLEATRQAMRTLRGYFDEQISPLCDRKTPPRWSLDQRVAGMLPLLDLLYERMAQEYRQLKDERRGLDFDDLEGLTASLLYQREELRRRWQNELRVVLVDEFQDTNDRQRQIVYALSGFQPGAEGARAAPTGDLFIVGDAKQSIYKFRGADVSVFRQVQADMAATGGLLIDLDLTFRAHRALVQSLNALLAPILGEQDDSQQLFRVPFAPLRAERQSPARPSIRSPFVEFHLGLGDSADSGRLSAAQALANRLQQLNRDEGFDWGQMALLFRASTAFNIYEDALEAAQIPFVTVAGRGFYDRPEIRDLLNALAAISDPSDDLALAGLLRSPAIGLSDEQLYHLRFPGATSEPQGLWQRLNDPDPDFDATQFRARDLIVELHSLSGRMSAAGVLKRFLDLSGYRAILGTLPGSRRLLRNVDKLLVDAHRSRLVGLGEFLEYIKTLRDTGLREGEAPTEAGGSLQLMTVHKAKGLEFPLVVIADASYDHRGGAAAVLLDPKLGVLPAFKDTGGAYPVAWRLASLTEDAKDDAENRRLLYVAATRAQEKLLVSGFTRLVNAGRLSLRGWLGLMGQATGLDTLEIPSGPESPLTLELDLPSPAGKIACSIYPPQSFVFPPPAAAPAPGRAQAMPHSHPDLIAPLQIPEAVPGSREISQREADPPRRVWRVIPRAQRPHGPAWVVGKLVHEAIRRWRFPELGSPAPALEAFLRPLALEAGLTDPVEIRLTLAETRRLLERLRQHPLYAEIDSSQRYHEVPYALPGDQGIIDLLYHGPQGWVIVDFKTDEARNAAEVEAIIQRQGYWEQLGRYVEAVTSQLGQRPLARLVFLQVGNHVQVVERDSKA